MTPITLQQAYEQADLASSKNSKWLPGFLQSKVLFTVSEKGWSFKQLNPIQRLGRSLFNAYPETHYKAIKAELDKLDDDISLRIKISWHRAKDPLFQAAEKTQKEIWNSFNTFDTKELLKNPNALDKIKEDVKSKLLRLNKSDFEKQPLRRVYHEIVANYISAHIVSYIAKNLKNPNTHRELQFTHLARMMLIFAHRFIGTILRAYLIFQTDKPLAEILDELCRLFWVDQNVALEEWAKDPGTAPETKKVINAILGDKFKFRTTYLCLWQIAKETAPHIREKLQKILDLHKINFIFEEADLKSWNDFKQKWDLK